MKYLSNDGESLCLSIWDKNQSLWKLTEYIHFCILITPIHAQMDRKANSIDEFTCHSVWVWFLKYLKNYSKMQNFCLGLLCKIAQFRYSETPILWKGAANLTWQHSQFVATVFFGFSFGFTECASPKWHILSHYYWYAESIRQIVTYLTHHPMKYIIKSAQNFK